MIIFSDKYASIEEAIFRATDGKKKKRSNSKLKMMHLERSFDAIKEPKFKESTERLSLNVRMDPLLYDKSFTYA